LSVKILFASLRIGLVAALAYYLHGLCALGQFDSAIMTTHELAAAEKFATAHPDQSYTSDLF